MESAQIITGISFRANVSTGSNSETAADLECTLHVEKGRIEIHTADGTVNFETTSGPIERLASQLAHVLDELKQANAGTPPRDCMHFFIEQLGKNAIATVEQFCESEDPFEATLTIETGAPEVRFWLGFSQSELAKVVTSLIQAAKN